ncbi:MAG: DUF58 domain-containing protein [Acidobacteria bacterium]|nr:DUF58 domain-containing protein [Acidobacteriota bacterium]
MALNIRIDRRAWIDFGLTSLLLGSAFVLAFVSSSISRTGDWAMGAFSAFMSLVLAIAGGLYIVPKLAKRVRWELWGLGIRTSITSDGMLYVVIVVVVGVAALNTANNLLYLILSTLLAFVVVSGNIARLVLHDVGVQLRFPDHLRAGEPARLSIALVNRKAIAPSCSISVEALPKRVGSADTVSRRRGFFRSKGRLKESPLAHFIVVPPRSTVKQIVEHTFERRGRYRFDTLTLATRFPSGFLRKWRDVKSSGEIVVFPRTEPVDDFFHTLPILTGTAASHMRGDGVDLFAFREYNQNDPIRLIDWKATARARRVMVRETVREEDFRLSIYFDPRRPAIETSEGFDERFERAIVVAASLAEHFIGEGAEVELVAPDVRVQPGHGNGHLHSILTELAVIEPQRHGDESPGIVSWDIVDALQGVSDPHRFKVLFTAAPRGTIPAAIWRAAHVIYTDEMPLEPRQ